MNPHQELKNRIEAQLRKHLPTVTPGSFLMTTIVDEFAAALTEPDQNNQCVLCQANLEKYNTGISIAMIEALIKISKAVYRKSQTRPFTEANDINVARLPGELELTHVERCSLTMLRHHGLIAKVKEAGKIKLGRWLITKKGWDFLRGEEVPDTVTTFRNSVIDHSITTTTIGDVLRSGNYSTTLETLDRVLAELPKDLT